MFYETLIGFRYLKTRKRSTFISIITLISIVGVTLGVATLAVALSVMNGFEKELLDRVVGANAHAIILRETAKFYDHEEVRKKVRHIKGIHSVAPIVIGETMISSGKRTVGIGIKGLDIKARPHFQALLQAKVGKKGSIEALVPPNPGELPGIAIGQDLARKLRVTHGDTVNLVSPISFFGMGHRREATHRAFRVTFIFRFGMFQYDSKFCFVHLKEAQAFFKLKGGVSGLEVLVHHFPDLNRIKQDVIKKIGRWPYKMRDWRQMNSNLFRAINQNKLALALILLFIILVACLNIAGTLILMVLEKRKDIAILRAMGSRSQSIMAIFMTYGLYIGALGTMMGLLLGFGVCSIANRIGIQLDASIYFISKLPIHIRPIEWVIVAAAALLITFLATIYPAIQASRQKPVEVLRD